MVATAEAEFLQHNKIDAHGVDISLSVIYDMAHLDGRATTDVPLIWRKRLLRSQPGRVRRAAARLPERRDLVYAGKVCTGFNEVPTSTS